MPFTEVYTDLRRSVFTLTMIRHRNKQDKPLRTGILYIVYCIKKNTEYIIQNTKYRKSAGFTLIEILISLFFVGVLIGIIVIASNTVRLRWRSDLQTIAAKAASKEIETLRSSSYSSIVPSTNQQCSGGNDLCNLPSGKLDRTVSQYQGDSSIKRVDIDVSWKNNTANTQHYYTTTLIYNGGL